MIIKPKGSGSRSGQIVMAECGAPTEGRAGGNTYCGDDSDITVTLRSSSGNGHQNLRKCAAEFHLDEGAYIKIQSRQNRGSKEWRP